MKDKKFSISDYEQKLIISILTKVEKKGEKKVGTLSFSDLYLLLNKE